MSPRSAEQYQTLREESRRKLLETALALFAHHGYERTSVRMIAREAGVAQGLLYRYFASKEDLLYAIGQQSIADIRESFAAADSASDPRQRLVRLIRRSFEIIRDNRQFWQLFYSLRMQPALLELMEPERRGVVELVRSTFIQHFEALGAADPSTEAALLFALIDGVGQHYVQDPEHYPLAAVVDRMIEIYCSPAQE